MKDESHPGRRRDVLAALALIVAAPRLHAQQAAGFRIGWISGDRDSGSSPGFEVLREGLRELGYAEGRNLNIEARWWGTGTIEGLEQLAFALASANPQLIVASGSPAILALKRVGAKMPVVFVYGGDPTEAGIVESLTRPGRNFTGMSLFSADIVSRRMQLVKEALPAAKRIALVSNPDHPGQNAELRAANAAAKTLGLDVEPYIVRTAAALEGVFGFVPGTRSAAIVVFPDTMLMRYSERFAQFAEKSRIPSISGWAEFAERGNLMTFGPNLRDAHLRLAGYVDLILKGGNPAELAVGIPTRTELVLNDKAAKALGIELPKQLLDRADKVLR